MSNEHNALLSGNFHGRYDSNGSSNYLISSTFGPEGAIGGSRGDHIPVNMILFSGNSIMLYTHESTLLNASNNSFRNLLPFPQENRQISDRVLFLPDIPSSELEIMLRAVHNVSSRDNTMRIDVQSIMRGIDRLSEFGIQPSECIRETSHFYQHLLYLAPVYPLEIYAVAAQYGMVSLAVTVSSHTLGCDLTLMSDDLLRRAGAVYVLKLHALHMERTDTLKKLLVGDLGLHNPTRMCDFTGQKVLKELWNLAVAHMLFLIKPDTTTSLIRETIMEHTGDVVCPGCKKLRDDQLAKVVNEWSLTSRTIPA